VRCQKCNIWYHEAWVGAKGKRRLIYGRCDWSELQHQVIGIGSTEIHCRLNIGSCLIIFYYNIKHFHIKMTHSSSYTEYVSALTPSLSQYLINLVHKICFTISSISCLYMFEHMCSSSGG
jgi:hypothetical protein